MRSEITGSKSRKVTGATVISWDPENMDVPVIKLGLPSGSDQLAANQVAALTWRHFLGPDTDPSGWVASRLARPWV